MEVQNGYVPIRHHATGELPWQIACPPGQVLCGQMFVGQSLFGIDDHLGNVVLPTLGLAPSLIWFIADLEIDIVKTVQFFHDLAHHGILCRSQFLILQCEDILPFEFANIVNIIRGIQGTKAPHRIIIERTK